MTVQMLCNEIGWPKFKYYRIRGGRQLLHRDAAERLAQILEVPEEWLTAGVAVAQRETTRKSQPEGSMPKKANPMRLHIAGTYTSEQLAAILAGLGGRSFAVELELRESPNEPCYYTKRRVEVCSKANRSGSLPAMQPCRRPRMPNTGWRFCAVLPICTTTALPTSF